MSDVHFENNSIKVKAALNDATKAWLHEASLELKSQTQRGCDSYVDTGQTKNSYTNAVDEAAGEAVVGSNYQNAIWEEFGTGIHAAKGDGRKTPWVYMDAEGQYHRTSGKKARHIFQKAFDGCKNKLVESLKAKLKGLN